jgi:hypothetical protein
MNKARAAAVAATNKAKAHLKVLRKNADEQKS